jgi:hypothetical protein
MARQAPHKQVFEFSVETEWLQVHPCVRCCVTFRIRLSPSLRIGAAGVRPDIGRYLIEESIMKATTLLNRTVFAALLISASAAAFANGGGPRGSGPYPYSGTAAMAIAATHADAPASATNTLSADSAAMVPGKTREQVRAELLQAEQSGLIPVHKNDYPPSAETVSRNRLRFQQVEQAWQRDEVTTTAEK